MSTQDERQREYQEKVTHLQRELDMQRNDAQSPSEIARLETRFRELRAILDMDAAMAERVAIEHFHVWIPNVSLTKYYCALCGVETDVVAIDSRNFLFP